MTVSSAVFSLNFGRFHGKMIKNDKKFDLTSYLKICLVYKTGAQRVNVFFSKVYP